MPTPESSTIETGGVGLTLIVTYTCAEEKQDELVDALDRSITEVYSRQPGFISASVHASKDRTRVLNYVQWERVQDFDSAGQEPEVQKHVAQIIALAETADPRLYDVRVVHRASPG